MSAHALLEPALALAVPLWMERHRDTPTEERISRAHELTRTIAEHGDAILYYVEGETAGAFNALAEGLALAALVAPGGVSFGDSHWDGGA